MTIKRWITACAIPVAALLGACTSEAAGTPGEGASGVQLALETIDEGVIEYRLTNGGKVAVRFARWRTALSRVPDRLFEVTRDGRAVRYTGPLATRAVPGPSSYVMLEPGESITAEVDLADFFDLSQGGEFEVRSALGAADVLEAAHEIEADFGSAHALIHVTPRAAAEGRPEVGAHRAELVFDNCRDGREEILTNISFNALLRVDDARATYDPDSNRANHYFGIGHSAEGVRVVLDGMWAAAADPDLKFVCLRDFAQCEEPELYAFVRSQEIQEGIHTIAVCDQFFEPGKLPRDDEKSASTIGVLLHEMAHLGGAVLHPDEYGYAAVRNLAATTPEGSFLNADSYRYYIMNFNDQ